MTVSNIVYEPIVRDRYGFFSNKSWLKFLEQFDDEEYIPNDDWYAALGNAGVTTSFLMFEDDASEELCIEFFETDNWCLALKQWNPKPPTDDWFLVSINDTDDGPCAVFVKYIV